MIVSISTTLTGELIDEGILREVISKIQTMRKDAGFEVMDRIRVQVSSDAKVREIIEKNLDYVRGELLADSVCWDSPKGFVREYDVNGHQTVFGVEKASQQN